MVLPPPTQSSWTSAFLSLVAEISDEKARQEAASFDHSKMKHVETVEKQALPTTGGNYSCSTPFLSAVFYVNGRGRIHLKLFTSYL